MALAPKYRKFHSMTASIWNFNNLSKIFTASEQLFTPVSSCRIGRAYNGNVSFKFEENDSRESEGRYRCAFATDLPLVSSSNARSVLKDRTLNAYALMNLPVISTTSYTLKTFSTGFFADSRYFAGLSVSSPCCESNVLCTCIRLSVLFPCRTINNDYDLNHDESAGRIGLRNNLVH